MDANATKRRQLRLWGTGERGRRWNAAEVVVGKVSRSSRTRRSVTTVPVREDEENCRNGSLGVVMKQTRDKRYVGWLLDSESKILKVGLKC